MDNSKGLIKNYAAGILISIAFYIVSMAVGSVFNVIISFASGYSEYSDFKNSGSVTGSLAVIVFSIANHVFTGWLTAGIMSKYGKRNGVMTKRFFSSAALSIVIFAAVILPVLFSKTPGLLVYLIHSLSVFYFGKKNIRKYALEQQFSVSCHSGDTQDSSCRMSFSKNKARCDCKRCGCPLVEGSDFCSFCGAKVK